MYTNIKNTFKRFPVPTLFYLTFSVLFQFLLERHLENYHNLLLTLLIGASIFFAINILFESYSLIRWKKNLSYIIGVLLIIFYYFNIEMRNEGFNTLRFLLFQISIFSISQISILLMIPIIPILFKVDYHREFRDISFKIIQVIFLVLLSMFILFLGITLAIVIIDALFDLDIDVWDYNVRLCVSASVTLCPFLFFLNLPILDNYRIKKTFNSNYIKVFINFILLPLTIIFLSISYGYLIYILFRGEIPKGIITTLNIGCSLLVLISNCILFNFKEDNKFYSFIYQYSFVFIIAPIIMILISTMQRVLQYGFTESRYIGFIIGLWFLFISIFNLFKSIKNYKMIFISLIVFLLLTGFGPSNALDVSVRSQFRHFKLITNKYDNMSEITKEDKERAENIVQFISMRSTGDILRSYLGLSEEESILNYFKELVPVESTPATERINYNYRNIRDGQKKITRIDKNNFLMHIDLFFNENKEDDSEPLTAIYQFSFSYNDYRIEFNKLFRDDVNKENPVASLDINKLLKEFWDDKNRNPITIYKEDFTLTFIPYGFDGNWNEDHFETLTYLDADILVQFKESVNPD